MQTQITERLLASDARHIWHPYASASPPPQVELVESAQGVYLQLADGRRVIDGMSSWWSVLHGYNHPELNQALRNQLDAMAHVMFGGLTHEPAIALAEQLVKITPSGLNRVFFSDSGSVAIEVALKQAIQYWAARGESRTRFLTIKRGYHGDTFAAMSICDPITGMHTLFSDAIPRQLFAEAPQSPFGSPLAEGDLQSFQQLLDEHERDIAAVVLEPIVQGAGGMRFYSAEYLAAVRQLSAERGILLIADEIATGLGRTGRLFACEHAAISPDILCLGKTLSAGYLTLAATLCTDAIAETICSAEPGVFMHGPTYMANPLACAVALKNLELLAKNDWQTQINNVERGLVNGLAEAKELAGVNDVRVLGGIGVVEMHQAVEMNALQAHFLNEQIWLRPFGKLVYTMPPYVITDEELAALCRGTVNALRHYCRSRTV